jgi:photosystem II stability/assembly factor-like uncharacterized protein
MLTALQRHWQNACRDLRSACHTQHCFLLSLLSVVVFHSAILQTTPLVFAQSLPPSQTLSQQSSQQPSSPFLPLVWQDANGALSGAVNALIADGARLYAGSGNGIAVSVNGGDTWQPANTGLGNRYITALAAHHTTQATVLYAGTSGVGSMNPDRTEIMSGVAVSHDSGKTWSMMGNLRRDVLAILPRPEGVYAGTWGGGVQFSADNGITWVARNEGFVLADTLQINEYPIVRSFAVLGRWLYVGLGQGVFRSSDSGKTWRKTPINNVRVSVVLSFGNRLYAATQRGVYCSEDSGATWQERNQGLTMAYLNGDVNSGWVYGLTVFSHGQDTSILVAIPNGLYRSRNHGITWEQVSRAFHGRSYFARFCLWGGTSSIFLSADEGLVRSNDTGKTWQILETGLNTGIRALVAKHRVISVGTNRGVYHSTDAGKNWFSNNEGLQDLAVSALAITEPVRAGHPVSHALPDSVQSAASFPQALLLAGTNTGKLWWRTAPTPTTTANAVESAESVESRWRAVESFPAASPIRAIACRDSLWFVGTAAGVWRSTNAGQTWLPVTQATLSKAVVNTIVADTAQPATWFVGTSEGLYRSTDDGRTWMLAQLPRSVQMVLRQTLTTGSLLIAASNDGLWHSTTNGLTWTLLQATAGLKVLALGAMDSTLFASTEQGLWRFEGNASAANNGKQWSAFITGLPEKTVVDVLTSDDDGVLIAGTLTNGVFRLRPNGVVDGVSIALDTTFRPHTRILYSRYQSPLLVQPNDSASIDLVRFVVRPSNAAAVMKSLTLRLDTPRLLRCVALVADGNLLAVRPVRPEDSLLTFSGLQWVIQPTDSTVTHGMTLTVRASFAAPVADNARIACSLAWVGLDARGALFPPEGMNTASYLAQHPLASSRRGDDNRLVVQADRLGFSQVSALAYTQYNFSAVVQAEDALGSRDEDVSGIAVTLTPLPSSGVVQRHTLTAASGLTKVLERGFTMWDDLRYGEQDELRLVAQSSHLRSGISPRIAVVGTSAEPSAGAGAALHGQTSATTSVHEATEIFAEQEPTLHVYPHPVRHEASIAYSIASATPAFVQLHLMTMLGASVVTLVEEYKSSGMHIAAFPQFLPAGVYVCVLRVSGGSGIRIVKRLVSVMH